MFFEGRNKSTVLAIRSLNRLSQFDDAPRQSESLEVADNITNKIEVDRELVLVRSTPDGDVSSLWR